MDPVKGTALLVHAFRHVGSPDVELDIFGITQNGASEAGLARLRSDLADDRRVRFLAPLDHAAIVDRLAEYDAAVVPSQWFETGPLVVLEAFAAGLPVIGSALGGVEEKVTDGLDGLLVRPHDSVRAWTDTLERVARDPDLLPSLRRGVQAPRQASDVARDMQQIYVDLISGPTAADLGRPHVDRTNVVA
jgi:glycosyltransferase involved in cell wall biosynthesis